jgi:hypothetical protein
VVNTGETRRAWWGGALRTPSCQLRLKARVNLGDQTAEFIPFEVISTAILTYFYPFLGTNVRILVSVINTRFQPDAPGWCNIESLSLSHCALPPAKKASTNSEREFLKS